MVLGQQAKRFIAFTGDDEDLVEDLVVSAGRNLHLKMHDTRGNGH